MEREGMAGEVLRLPFVFVPNGAETPAAWRAAHPEAVSLPARLVVRGGVQRVQFIQRRRFAPPSGGSPQLPRDRTGELLRWLKQHWPSILPTEGDQERWVRPPPGSRPIAETPWSGNHEEIKDAIGAGPKDDTRIAPNGDVWGKNPDETWTNHGPASDFTGSGKATGRKGRDRDRRGSRRD
jgi:hypothetical protein